jgi:putative SOS response-associated peptidase YedK
MHDAEILERFGVRVRTAIYKARYNCAPSQNLAVITNVEPGTLDYFRWGLIPSWAREMSVGSKMINARAETILEKPSFKNAFRHRRCLIPATGFFEWRRDKERTPFNIRLKTHAPFCFAGLWDQWKTPEGETLRTFTIITTTPNELMADIHDRMPVILHTADEPRWLGMEGDGTVADLLRPYPAEFMEAYPVSKLVNSPSNDTPGVLERQDILF